MSTRQWQYARVVNEQHVFANGDRVLVGEDLDAFLDGLGRNGWELTGVNRDVLYFKRQLS